MPGLDYQLGQSLTRCLLCKTKEAEVTTYTGMIEGRIFPAWVASPVKNVASSQVDMKRTTRARDSVDGGSTLSRWSKSPTNAEVIKMARPRAQLPSGQGLANLETGSHIPQEMGFQLSVRPSLEYSQLLLALEKSGYSQRTPGLGTSLSLIPHA